MTGRSELLSIIVPVFNEARTVAAVLDRLLTIQLPLPREILVVNDGSTDDTRSVLDGLPVSPQLNIIHAARNGGKGRAIRIGLGQATGTILAIQDADLELDPSQLDDLVKAVLDGRSDVVYGSRFLQGRPDAPWSTVVGNRVLTFATNALFGSRLTDMETCYKIMRTEVARSLELQSDRFDIEPEMTARLLVLGHRILEMPVRFQPRLKSEGKKIRWRDGARALQVLIHHRLSRSRRTHHS